MPYRSVNPTTGDVIRTFPNHTDAEIESALVMAHSVNKSTWSTGQRRPRLAVLTRLADVIAARAEELARVLVLEMGKRVANDSPFGLSGAIFTADQKMVLVARG